MSHDQIIRAWKDSEFRNSLSEDQLEWLPEHPAGILEELTDRQLSSVAGGARVTYGGDESCYSGIIACTLPINCAPEQ